jgi:hypothetical protein
MDYSLLEKLETFYIRFKEIGQLITDPEVIQDMKRYVRLTKEYKEFEEVTAAGDKYKLMLKALEESKEILATELEKDKTLGSVRLYFNGEEAEGSYPILLSWDGTPVVTKSTIEKGGENAAEAVSGIFKSDRVFVILFILLLLVIFVCLPIFRASQILHKKKRHRPKH